MASRICCVRAAAADVAGQGFLDLGRRRLGVLVEGGTHGHDEAGRAEAALLGVVLDERRRHRVELAAVDEALGRLDLLALCLQRQHGAGVDGFAVEHHGAGAAGAAVADALAAGDIEVVAQGVEQRDARLDRGSHVGVVDIERQLDRARPDGRGLDLGGRRLDDGGQRRLGQGGGGGRRSRCRGGSHAVTAPVCSCCVPVVSLISRDPPLGWQRCGHSAIAKPRWRWEDSKGGERREQGK